MALVTRDRIWPGYVNHASKSCAYRGTCQSTKNPPNYTEEIGSGPVMSITYLELVLNLPIKFHPNLSTLNFLQDFWFPRFSFLPSTPKCVWIRSKLKKDYLRHVFIVLARLEYRTHQSTGNLPSPNSPKESRSGYFIHISRTCAYSSHQVSSRSLHSKRFSRFPVFPFNSHQYHWIQ